MTGDPSAPEQTPTAEQPETSRLQDLQRWVRELVVRLRKPPREIFAGGRIYNRIRISTVVLLVAFIGVLMLYQTVRPAPTGGSGTPGSTSEQQSDDTAPVDTSETPSTSPRPTTTAPTTSSSTEPGSTEAPTGSEEATPTTAAPSQPAPTTGGGERATSEPPAEPPAAAPTSAPAATP